MERRRLKQIAILILLTLNIALLLLLGSRQLQERRHRQETEQQLHTLYGQYGLTFSPDADLQQTPLPILSLTRQTNTELALATKLLGETPAVMDRGSRIYHYTGSHGTIQFHSNGSIEGIALSVPVAHPRDFALGLFRSFGLTVTKDNLVQDSGEISAIQTVQGVFVNGCELTLRFENSVLTHVFGVYVSTENATQSSGNRCTCATALTLLLSHYRSSGVVFQQVEHLTRVYRLQSTPDSLALVPLWKIVTDTSTWLVDCSANTVERTP